MCEKHATAVERNFRVLVDLPWGDRSKPFSNEVTEIFGLPPTLESDDSYTVLLYSNCHDKVYRIPVRSDMMVEELLQGVRRFFKLPQPTTFRDVDILVQLEHAICFDGKLVPFNQTVAAAGIKAGHAVTYWTRIRYRDLEGELRADVIHMMTAAHLGRTKQARRDIAVSSFEKKIKDRFEELDALLDTDG